MENYVCVFLGMFLEKFYTWLEKCLFESGKGEYMYQDRAGDLGDLGDLGI